MRTIIVLLTLFIILGFANMPASAELMVKDYEQYKDKEMIRLYVHGVGEGYKWANVALEQSKQKPLFCQQERLAVTADNYLRILGDTIKEMRQKGMDLEKYPVALILLEGLQKTFPCEK